ncbi:unnamed protein product [Plutella xylostella]|uniref:Defective in cullin neddylation protein n=1 Tax=Plutella xylostella TaxID=51655 RepID=A0A8S4FX17_PLUXY|nr:unnamed protein product [Plutella xylostella]
MGHCLSCFQQQANNDNPTSQKIHDGEMTDIITTNEVPALVVSDCPPEEPLLHSNDNSVNCHRQAGRDTTHNTNTQNMHGDNNIYIEGLALTKVQLTAEKANKPFYQKLPSIPRTMSSLGSNENRLNPDDFKVLVLAWKLNASQMCRFTKLEFTQGLKNMKTDSIKGIQQKLSDITSELRRDSEQFKDLYRFTFKFGLDVSTGQRILPADIAIVLWRLVFTSNEPPILERWLAYLEASPHVRGVPKDTWYMFLNFCEFVGEDLSSYDDTEAWPSLFDDFVEYENDQMNQNITKNDIRIQD